MSRNLSKKQKGFVKDFVATGNGTQAALNNYDIKSTDKANVAAAIASENLGKPNIQDAIKSIADQIPDDLLVQKHKELLNATELQHMTFPLGPKTDKEDKVIEALPSKLATILDAEMELQRTTLTDEEIISMLASVNCTVKNIVHGEHARHVYYWARDNNAISKALDLAYKIKGTYAPEKRETSLKVESLQELQNATKSILEQSKV